MRLDVGVERKGETNTLNNKLVSPDKKQICTELKDFILVVTTSGIAVKHHPNEDGT